jgi:hypothetical protein
MSDRYVAPHNIVSRAGAGVVGGIAGGLLLGLVLWLLGDLDDMGRLVGAHTIAASWVLTVVVSAVAGAVYGVLFGRLVAGTVPAIGVGIVYGTALWVLVRLVAVPIATSGKFFAIDTEMLSLVAFAVFGVLLGLIYAETGPKRNWRPYRRQQLDVVYAVPSASRRRRRRRRDDDDD